MSTEVDEVHAFLSYSFSLERVVSANLAFDLVQLYKEFQSQLVDADRKLTSWGCGQ